MNNYPFEYKIKKHHLVISIIGFFIFLITFGYFRPLHVNLFWELSDYVASNVERGVVGDARYYFLQAIKLRSFSELYELSLINKNIFMPIAYGKIVNNNIYIVYFINIFLLIYSVKKLSLYLTSRKVLYISLVLIHPVVIGALFGISKEVAAYCSIILMMTYILSKDKKLLFFSLFLALFARFEMAVLMTIFSITTKLEKKYRPLMLLGLLVGISGAIVIKNYTQMEWLEMNAREGSWGLVRYMDTAARNGFYPFVFPIRTGLNFFAETLVPPVTSPLYRLFLLISNYIFLLLTLIISFRRNFSLKNDFFFLIVVYSMFMSVPSFVAHRYFVPIYPLMLFLAIYKVKGYRS